MENNIDLNISISKKDKFEKYMFLSGLSFINHNRMKYGRGWPVYEEYTIFYDPSNKNHKKHIDYIIDNFCFKIFTT